MLRALRRVWQPPCRQWLNRFFFFPFPCWWKIFFSRFIILQVFLPRFASSCLFPCVSAGADGRAALGTAARLGPGQLPGWHTHGGDVAACPCRALCAWLRETFRNYPCPWTCLARCSSPGVGSHGVQLGSCLPASGACVGRCTVRMEPQCSQGMLGGKQASEVQGLFLELGGL